MYEKIKEKKSRQFLNFFKIIYAFYIILRIITLNLLKHRLKCSVNRKYTYISIIFFNLQYIKRLTNKKYLSELI